MKVLVTKMQHCGLPTKDIEKTIEFLGSLGFEIAYQTITEQNQKVAFLKSGDVVIETYEESATAEKPGAWDHVAFDVEDIEKTFEEVKERGYEALEGSIQFLPFWDNGVKFFTIMGPNGEKLEFSQML
ncbi:MAG: VOC family protein [Lachnospiraceae bacterium]|nr:VOC family protein [Lachnospiraceae bacterium]